MTPLPPQKNTQISRHINTYSLLGPAFRDPILLENHFLAIIESNETHAAKLHALQEIERDAEAECDAELLSWRNLERHVVAIVYEMERRDGTTLPPLHSVEEQHKILNIIWNQRIERYKACVREKIEVLRREILVEMSLEKKLHHSKQQISTGDRLDVIHAEPFTALNVFDILQHVLSFLPFEDIISWTSTCSILHQLCKNYVPISLPCSGFKAQAAPAYCSFLSSWKVVREILILDDLDMFVNTAAKHIHNYSKKKFTVVTRNPISFMDLPFVGNVPFKSLTVHWENLVTILTDSAVRNVLWSDVQDLEIIFEADSSFTHVREGDSILSFFHSLPSLRHLQLIDDTYNTYNTQHNQDLCKIVEQLLQHPLQLTYLRCGFASQKIWNSICRYPNLQRLLLSSQHSIVISAKHCSLNQPLRELGLSCNISFDPASHPIQTDQYTLQTKKDVTAFPGQLSDVLDCTKIRCVEILGFNVFSQRIDTRSLGNPKLFPSLQKLKVHPTFTFAKLRSEFLHYVTTTQHNIDFVLPNSTEHSFFMMFLDSRKPNCTKISYNGVPLQTLHIGAPPNHACSICGSLSNVMSTSDPFFRIQCSRCCSLDHMVGFEDCFRSLNLRDENSIRTCAANVWQVLLDGFVHKRKSDSEPVGQKDIKKRRK